MILVGLAVLAVVASAALSLRAAGRLPEDARVPVHSGLQGWDRYVSRKRGLWEWPLVVAFVGLIFSVMGIAGTFPQFIAAIFVASVGFILWHQRAAFKHAAEGGGQDAGPSPNLVPKWVAALLTGALLVPLVLLAALFLWPRGGPPSEIRVDGGRLVVTMSGPYKAFSLRSTVRVPLASIVGVRVDPNSRNLPRGFRVGTSAPGVIAGRFTSDECKAFWAIDDGSDAVVIDLQNADFHRLVVEVEDPGVSAKAIRGAARLGADDAWSSACDE